MKKIYLIIYLMLLAIEGKSQILIDADKDQIKKYMVGINGILRFDKKGLVKGKSYDILTYNFSNLSIRSKGVYLMSFYLDDHDKYYKYFAMYGDDKFLKPFIDQFDNPGSGLKRIGKDLKWVDITKEYEIEIFNSKSNKIKTTIFMLDIHKANIAL